MPDSPAVNIVDSVVHEWSLGLMERLLLDRTTRENIMWADDEYQQLGEGYQPYDPISVSAITGSHSGVIKARIMKDAEQQAGLTKRKAEVFTPSWLCNQMNNALDGEWFGRCDVFNIQIDKGWETREDSIEFGTARGCRWQDYIDRRMLEITCGEAPFLCSRYDTTTGSPIPVSERIGLLDRKLRIATENTASYEDWLKWAYRSLESTYGYEFQGDNLIIARINVLMTFAEHMRQRWGRMPTESEAVNAARIITWNIWQMDGLHRCVPSERAIPAKKDPRIEGGQEEAQRPKKCVIYDWRAKKPQTFESLRST